MLQCSYYRDTETLWSQRTHPKKIKTPFPRKRAVPHHPNDRARPLPAKPRKSKAQQAPARGAGHPRRGVAPARARDHAGPEAGPAVGGQGARGAAGGRGGVPAGGLPQVQWRAAAIVREQDARGEAHPAFYERGRLVHILAAVVVPQSRRFPRTAPPETFCCSGTLV